MLHVVNVLLRLAFATVAIGYVVLTIWFPEHLNTVHASISEAGIPPEQTVLGFAGAIGIFFLFDALGMVFLSGTAEPAADDEESDASFLQRLFNASRPRYMKVRGLVAEAKWPEYIDKIRKRTGVSFKFAWLITPPDEHGIANVVLAIPELKVQYSRPFSTRLPRHSERLIREKKMEIMHLFITAQLQQELPTEDDTALATPANGATASTARVVHPEAVGV